jgi:hypothetical protein
MITMGSIHHLFRKPILLFLIAIGIWMIGLPRAFHPPSPAANTPHRVHIAFGFHVNLYHSFRGDTNDENGFGQDIRVIRHTRQLTPTQAHNPVTCHNPATGERIIVLPTYHAGDLVENVSLRDWAERLHRLQDEGKIDRDVLIFINFDADAEFWAGADLPWHLNWLPNTGGLAQLVESVSDLDFVRFSNVSDYLASHEPVGTIRFGQDTADGSFNGYNSWAEKAYASDYWSRIERNRRVHRVARKLLAMADGQALSLALADLMHGSFETRLRALSTTNFGLATPFLTHQREALSHPVSPGRRPRGGNLRCNRGDAGGR